MSHEDNEEMQITIVFRSPEHDTVHRIPAHHRLFIKNFLNKYHHKCISMVKNRDTTYNISLN